LNHDVLVNLRGELCEFLWRLGIRSQADHYTGSASAIGVILVAFYVVLSVKAKRLADTLDEERKKV